MPNQTNLNHRLWLFLLLYSLPALGLVGYFGFKKVDLMERAARSNDCLGNLNALSMAMQDYRSEHGHFPPPVFRKRPGEPEVSWRVLLLDIIDRSLFKDYNVNEPWDSLANSKLISRMPSCFLCPASGNLRNAGMTNYFMITGNGTLFGANEFMQSKKPPGELDSKLMIVEAVGSAIPWTKPDDLSIDHISLKINDPDFAGLCISSHHGDYANVAFLNGEIGRLCCSTPNLVVRSLVLFK